MLQASERPPTMRDPEYDLDEERPYECFECGTVVNAAETPDRCPRCGGEMRNRLLPIE